MGARGRSHPVTLLVLPSKVEKLNQPKLISRWSVFWSHMPSSYTVSTESSQARGHSTSIESVTGSLVSPVVSVTV